MKPIVWLPDDFQESRASSFRRPIHTFLLKIASRCNLDCAYCYVYQSPDKSWETKPVFLEQNIAERVAYRIQEHVSEHELKDVTLVFHGGEPLLAGLARIRTLVDTFSSALKCQVHWGMQSNGVLLDDETVTFLAEQKFRIGISLDGTKEQNDKNRNYHNGKSSYGDAVDAIRLLTTNPQSEAVFGGVLVVIDLEHSPAEILRTLGELHIKSANLLLPDAHYESPPRGSEAATAPYGEWLCQFFDEWRRDYPQIEIPYFEQIIAMMLGGTSTAEEIGAQSVDLIVVETNGDIEAVDTLKIVGREATSLGMNVWSHSFDDALRHPAIYSRMSGFEALCQECRECEHVANCGGGYLPHRYGRKNGFVNPSVYCADLKVLFAHIHLALQPLQKRDTVAY